MLTAQHLYDFFEATDESQAKFAIPQRRRQALSRAAETLLKHNIFDGHVPEAECLANLTAIIRC